MLFTVVSINYDRLTNIDVRALVDSAGSPAAAIAVVEGIYLIKGLTFVIPAMLIYVSVGMAFNAPTAVAISLAGIAIEVTAAYWLGRLLGGDYVQRILSKNKGGKKLLEMGGKQKGSALLVIRALPVFPIDFASLFLGSGKYPFLQYLIISVVGIAPRVILFTLLGDKAYDLIPMDLLLKIVLILLPVLAVVFTVSWIIKRRKKI